MRVMVIAGRVARQAWTHGGMCARVCDALIARGHEVELVCQALDDAQAFEGCSNRLVFERFRESATEWPFGFATFARRARKARQHDVSLSLSRVAGGDVWLPLEPSGRSWVLQAWRARGLLGFALAMARHHGALRAQASDVVFLTPGGEPPGRVMAVGSVSAGEATRLLHGAALGNRVVMCAWPVMDGVTREELTEELRDRTRKLLDIEPTRCVVFLSAPETAGGELDALLEAVADVNARENGRGPVLLIACKECYSVHERARRAGAAEHVRIVGLTAETVALWACSDVGCVALRAGADQFAGGAMGRHAAMSLAMGRPLIALSGASGYELARLRNAAQEPAGLVVDVPTREAWARALRSLSDGFVERARAAAEEIGAGLTHSAFIDALETALVEASELKKGPAPGQSEPAE